MSSGDAAVYQSIGNDLLHSFVAVTVETFLIAVYSILVLETGRLLLRKTRTRVSVCTCFVVFLMFGLALALWMIDIHNVVTEIQITLLDTSTAPLSDVYFSAVQKILRLASVEDVVYSYLTILGDTIIIWRVYAFWSRGKERLVLIIPIAFLLGSISTSMMLSYCAARLGADIALGTYQHPAFCRNIQTASYSTTLATTGVATILIGYKTWEYRQTHLEAFGKMSRQTRTQKIMLMLVESGVIYMLFFVVQVVMSLSSVNESIEERPALAFALTIYQYITSLIVGIYPTVVVVLVNSKHSVLRPESEGGTAQGGIKFKSTLGTGTTQSTYLNTNSSAMSMSASRGGPPATTVDLYEMSRVSSEGKAGAGIGIGVGEVLKDPALTVRVQQSAETYHV
ncbi:hypothetical protein C8Q70DRAFT_922311 [Cubamyces menziesii]|uniref:Uncharacterized protein n=1 Tax=Trametes cubensis TaxID=1111947 RepID=A0AAD7TXL1_9APHY|nr:hypothetical protein C8Q70DRAFT_922311 [Cubamyces menziesii]KAJ8483278.1 hypothetical protein ONZ51_g4835 [Trametes cubensis]